MYKTVQQALERARSGKGPTLIEAVTWRYGAHTTADDPTKYRDQTQSDENRKTNDPLKRLEMHLKEINAWTDNWFEKLQAKITAEINNAVEEMEAFSKPDVNDLFDHVFATPVWPIEEQKARYLDHVKGVSS